MASSSSSVNISRRQLVPASQHIPDAGCALDRDTMSLQRRDIPGWSEQEENE